MSIDYVKQVGEVYRVAGSRVSLDSIVYCFGMAIRPKPSSSHFRCSRSSRCMELSRTTWTIRPRSTNTSNKAKPTTKLNGKQLERLTRCFIKRWPSAADR